MKIKDALKIDGNSYAKRELISYLRGIKFDEIYANLECDFAHFDEFCKLLARFKNGEPLAYLTSRAEFFGLDFYVDESALIPREETEILVEKTAQIALNLMDNKEPNLNEIIATNLRDKICDEIRQNLEISSDQAQSKKENQPIKICEIGCGTGIIAICLKLLLPSAQITALDISEKALILAQKNASKFATKITFFKSDLLSNINENFDIIVSNPPYIARDYSLDLSVLKEPHIALFGGEIGDEILKKIVNLSAKRAKFLCCEMGFDQKNSLDLELKKCNFTAKFYKDLAGFDRGFIAKNANFGVKI
ncbi:MAG: HemK/PrmC family methyltransferase [Campylobacter sp.]